VTEVKEDEIGHKLGHSSVRYWRREQSYEKLDDESEAEGFRVPMEALIRN
jgi:hypothetical protein